MTSYNNAANSNAQYAGMGTTLVVGVFREARLLMGLATFAGPNLMILDEPTLGLDILFRKQFYDSLINDYYDGDRTIVITTHHAEEIEHILTDVVFINDGRIALNATMDALQARYTEVRVDPAHVERARALGPLRERQVFGRSTLLFDGIDAATLESLGEVRTPGITDLFVALIGNSGTGLEGNP